MAKGRQKGEIIKNWLDDYEWLIDAELHKYFNNISFAARSLTKQLKNRDGEFVVYSTFRAQLSRWLKRRKKIKELAKIHQLNADDDLVKLVSQLQDIQYGKKKPLSESKAKLENNSQVQKQ